MLSLPEGLKEALARVDKVKHGAKLETFEVERQLKDGRHLFVSVTLSLIKDASGQPVGLSTLSRDITERKEAEKVLAERARLLDLTDDAIIVRDLEGHILYWNQGAEKLYGWPREEAVGKITHSLLNTQFSKPLEQITKELLKNNRWEGEFVQTRRDGQSVTVLARKALDRDKQGNPTAILETLTDITARKQAEEKLHMAQTLLADRAGQLEQAVVERTAELTRTNEQLEAFVYSIAHDLRAPLRAMQGFSAMLVEEDGASLSEKGRDFANRINSSARFMDALLIDLLAFSRITQERLELTSLQLGPLVASVLSRLQSEIQERNGHVENAGPWPAVLAHEPTVAQVLVNLLDNALKFVPPDVRPIVRVRTDEQPSGNWVRVWVEDNGIGIAPDHQDQVFRLFTRLHGEKHPGTGIGLAIVQKGVERMGGRAGVESTPGQGSCFWFELKKASP
jgi:PAS domain S-box-containing protein